MLGLARRAGKTASGQFQAENAVRSGKAKLVILAADASGNTKKHFRDMCSFRHIPCLVFGDKEKIGRCLGQEARSVAALTEISFADAILRLTETVNTDL